MESFESWHDAEEWGPLSSTDGELVSVPDLVRRQMLAPLPLVPAVDTVLDAIERDGAVNWYLTTRGNYAIKVRDDLAWPDRLIIDRVTETGASSGTIVFGLKRPGTLGLMDYMRAYWMLRSRPRRLYDPVLDSYQLAILRKDADRLFGRDTSDPADVKAAPPAFQSERSPAVELKPTKKPGEDWTPAVYADLLRQYESLTTGPNAMKGEAAREALGKAWSYAPNSIKPFLTTARKQRNPTT